MEGYEFVGAHILDVLSQFLLEFRGIVVPAGAIDMETPLTVCKSKSSTTDIQAVYGGAGHKADAGHSSGHFVLD
jgi:hypothetical protein